MSSYLPGQSGNGDSPGVYLTRARAGWVRLLVLITAAGAGLLVRRGAGR